MRCRSRSLALLIAVSALAASCGDTEPPDLGAGETVPPGTDAPTTTAPPATTTTEATAPTTTEDPGPVIPPVPDPTFGEAGGGGGLACIGTRIGISCLDDSGWNHFDRGSSGVVDWAQVVVPCDDGTVAAETLDGVAVYDGSSWATIDADFSVSGPNTIACRDGVIWAGFFGWVGRYADGAWTSWNSEEVLGVSQFVKSVDDVAIAPDGSAWVVTGSSAARFADDTWTVWEEGAGFDSRFSPDAIDVDDNPDGTYRVVVAAGSTGLATWENDAWTRIDTSLNGDDSIEARNGQVYVPAFRTGVSRFEGAAETEITPADGLSSSEVREIQVDDAGSIWFATDYGLTVFVDGEARTYRVDNSGLLDNNTYSIAVTGSGPTLPADAPEEWATAAGVVLDTTGQPLVGAPVQVCVQEQRDEFDGATPCEDHPYFAEGETDETGRFEIHGLRAGRYSLTLQPGERWTYFTDGTLSAWYDAPANETAEWGIFEITSGG